MRFAGRDVPRLLDLAERVRSMDLSDETLAVFALAAEAARTGEPLIVECESHLEAQMMADGYVRYGVSRPVVEELMGQRPAR